MAIEAGKIYDGVVANITNFGAFIQLPEGRTGLVHISEVADNYVKDIRVFLTEKDKVKVKVLSVDNNKINLSIKQAPPVKKVVRPVEIDWSAEAKKTQGSSFEDMMAKFSRDSEDKMAQLKKSAEPKRHSTNKKTGTLNINDED